MSEHARLETMAASVHDLSAEERRELDAHLAACPSCRTLAQEYGRQDVFLRALPLPAPDASLRRGVFSRIEQRPARRLSALRGGLLFAGPALMMVLAVVLITARTAPAGTSTTLRALPDPIYGPASRAPASGYDAAAQEPSRVEGVPASPLIPGPFRVDTVSAGIRLTLIAPRTAYPRDALVPVQIEVKNTTHDLAWIHAGSLGECEGTRPVVEAIDSHGQPVDPLPGRPIPSCPLVTAGAFYGSPSPRAPGYLLPGKTLRTRSYVVLLTDRLRVRTGVSFFHECDPRTRPTCPGFDRQIIGKPLVFSPAPGRAPRIQLHGLPPSSFRLLPAQSRPQPLWYQGWFACGPALGSSWGFAEGGVGSALRPGNGASLRTLTQCSSKQFMLHLVAGHPGEPVAFISERRGRVHG